MSYFKPNFHKDGKTALYMPGTYFGLHEDFKWRLRTTYISGWMRSLVTGRWYIIWQSYCKNPRQQGKEMRIHNCLTTSWRWKDMWLRAPLRTLHWLWWAKQTRLVACFEKCPCVFIWLVYGYRARMENERSMHFGTIQKNWMKVPLTTGPERFWSSKNQEYLTGSLNYSNRKSWEHKWPGKLWKQIGHQKEENTTMTMKVNMTQKEMSRKMTYGRTGSGSWRIQVTSGPSNRTGKRILAITMSDTNGCSRRNIESSDVAKASHEDIVLMKTIWWPTKQDCRNPGSADKPSRTRVR